MKAITAGGQAPAALPDAALDDRLAFVGTSGSGKTYAAGTAVERLLASGARVGIIDPLDVWWGLRLESEGVSAGFPVVVFGGSHGDLPITEHSGGVIGEAAACMAESFIVSLGGLGTKSAERRFMLAFLERLYRRAAGEPLHLIFDEADLWAPQRTSEPQLQSLMEQIVRRGRVKGFIPWLITQRPAVLSKDVLSQADGLVAMKLTSSQDRDAIGGWIEGQADRADEKRMLARLPQLPRGRGAVWIPGRGILDEVSFPAKRTYDSSRTPKRGAPVRTATLRPLDVGAVKARLAAIEVEAKSKAERTPGRAITRTTDDGALDAAEERGRRRGLEDGKRVGYAEGYRDGYRAAKRDAQTAVAALRPSTDSNVVAERATAPSGESPSIGAERKPLATLARMYPAGLTEAQWATLAGLKRSGGTWSTYRSRLKTAGLISQQGDLWKATPLGLATAGDTPPAAETPEERVVMWKKALGAAGKLLDVLVACYPGEMSRADLAERCGLEPTGGTFLTYLSRLSGNGLIQRSGDVVKASDALFLNGGETANG